MSDIGPVSGMVKIAPDDFLCVYDRKNRGGADLDNQDWFHRCAVFNAVNKHGADLRIGNWPSATPRPSDVEAVCALAGRPDEYLLVESGFYEGNFGRVVHVEVAKKASLWVVGHLGQFVPFAAPEENYTTPKADKIEGAAMVEGPGGRILLVVATRGDANTAAMVRWSSLEVDGDTLRPGNLSGSTPLAQLGGQLGDRGAASLRLVPEGESWRVWSVATYIPDEGGPFRSVIYSAGLLQWDGSNAPTYDDADSITVWWTIEGLKVEGIALPADSIPMSVLSIAADDEEFGGVWRPLAESERPKVVSPEVIASGMFSLSTLI